MDYAVSLTEVKATYLAAVRATVTRQTLGATIRRILAENKIYQFIKTSNLEKAGHNVFIYETDRLRNAGNEIDIEIGVQVAGPFEGNGEVICSATPEGRAAMTVHTGHYDRIGQAHSAVMTWARAQSIALTGRNWEIYGDWQEDPNQLTTEVFYLLK